MGMGMGGWKWGNACSTAVVPCEHFHQKDTLKSMKASRPLVECTGLDEANPVAF